MCSICINFYISINCCSLKCPFGRSKTMAKKEKNAVAEMANWQQRCVKELSGGKKWEENWGHIFGEEGAVEGASVPIEDKIKSLETKLSEYVCYCKHALLSLSTQVCYLLYSCT